MNTKEKLNSNKATGIPDISLRKAAILARIGFLMSFVGAMYASLNVNIGELAIVLWLAVKGGK